MTEMRILTVRQPWAWAIIHGGKTVENRVRNIAGSWRGPVAIHAAKANDVDAWTAMGQTNLAAYTRALEARESLIGGAIIGVVDLVDVHTPTDCWQKRRDELVELFQTDRKAFAALPDNGMGGLIGKCSLCSPWADDSNYHLKFETPRQLAEPIPCKGALGLRRLDPETIAWVLVQTGETK